MGQKVIIFYERSHSWIQSQALNSKLKTWACNHHTDLLLLLKCPLGKAYPDGPGPIAFLPSSMRSYLPYSTWHFVHTSKHLQYYI